MPGWCFLLCSVVYTVPVLDDSFRASGKEGLAVAVLMSTKQNDIKNS